MKNSIKIGLVPLAISSFATFAASAQETEKIKIKTVLLLFLLRLLLPQ